MNVVRGGVAVFAIALLVPLVADGQSTGNGNNSSGNTTHTGPIHQGEPLTNHPGGNPGWMRSPGVSTGNPTPNQRAPSAGSGGAAGGVPLPPQCDPTKNPSLLNQIGDLFDNISKCLVQNAYAQPGNDASAALQRLQAQGILLQPQLNALPSITNEHIIKWDDMNRHLPQPWKRVVLYLNESCLLSELGNKNQWIAALNDNKKWREFEKCNLIKVEQKPDRLPNLSNGVLEAWGRSSINYNCFGYAAKPSQPPGWIGPRDNGETLSNIPVSSYGDLKKEIQKDDWTESPTFKTNSPPVGEERLVLYQKPNGLYTHAALWTHKGIFAKMGVYGVFRFSSLDQMSGEGFGSPKKMFTRDRRTPPIS
ncbi:MAG: hypothetical protein KIT00_10330 [Rhodospirillales bacterium]|nr:hypothetical protein [Rhodospirillales bacterium]